MFENETITSLPPHPTHPSPSPSHPLPAPSVTPLHHSIHLKLHPRLGREQNKSIQADLT